MATINTKIKLSDFQNVISAYKEHLNSKSNTSSSSLENDLINKNQEISALKAELKELDAFIGQKREKVDTRLLTDMEIRLEKTKKELEETKKTNVTLLANVKERIKKELVKNKQALDKAEAKLKSFKQTDASTLTPAKQKQLQSDIAKLESDIKKALKPTYEIKLKVLKKDDEKIALIEAVQKKVDDLKEKIRIAKIDVKENTRKINNADDKFLKELQTKKQRRNVVLARLSACEKKELPAIKNKISEVDISKFDNLDTFKEFLKNNGLSTTHADILYNLYKDENYKFDLHKEEFKLRDKHPKLKKWGKRLLVGLPLAGGLLGGSIGTIQASKAVAGSTVGLLPVSSIPLTNYLVFGSTGALAGIGAAAALLGTAKLIESIACQVSYGSAKTAIKDLENGKQFDDTRLSKLIVSIEKNKDKILDLRSGSNNILTKPIRAIRRFGKNIINRIRVRKLENITKDLMLEFEKIYALPNDQVNAQTKYEKLTPIAELIGKINNHVKGEIRKSKIHALLTCEDTKKAHTHQVKIENLDIYSDLNIYLENVKTVNPTRKEKKVARKVARDYKQRTTVAQEILNEQRSVGGLVLKRYQQLASKVVPVKHISNFLIVDNTLKVKYSDGKVTTYDIENGENISKVDISVDGKKLILTYEDNSQVKISATPKKTKQANITPAVVLDYLKDENFIEKLSAKGFEKSIVKELKVALNKKRLDSKYTAIYNVCAELISEELKAKSNKSL